MQCEFCGEEVSEGALACPRCGSPVARPAAQEKPATPPPPAAAPPPPTGASIQRPAKPVPQTPTAQPPQTDAGSVPAEAPGTTPQESTPPWEIQAPAVNPTQISWQTQPEQAPDHEPPHAPLAKQEKDFIALAEEKARLEQPGTLPPDSTSEIPRFNGALPPEVDMVDRDLPPC